MNNEILEFNFSEIEEIMDNVYLIERGVRSCYTSSISGPIDDYEYADGKVVLSVYNKLKQIEEYIKSHNLYFYSYKYKKEDDDFGDHESFCIWVYKYPHQGKILKMLPGQHGYLEEWITGKLLNYSDECMEEFLSDHPHNDL